MDQNNQNNDRPERKAHRETMRRRIDEIVQIMLDGAVYWDVRQYITEKATEPGSPWELKNGRDPFSERTIRAYMAKAEKAMTLEHGKIRDSIITTHLAKRRHLYAKANLQGDVRTAHQILKDEAEFLGLYEKGRILKQAAQNLSKEKLSLLADLLTEAEFGATEREPDTVD